MSVARHKKYYLSIAVFTFSALIGWFANSVWHKNQVDANSVEVLEATAPVQKEASAVVNNQPEPVVEARKPLKADPGSIVDYLRERSKGGLYSGMSDKNLRNLIHQTPGLAEALLEKLIDLDESETKRNLSKALLGQQIVKRAGLDRFIIEKIKQDVRRSEWLEVLGDLGIQSTESLRYVSEQLPLLTEAQDITSAINAIAGPWTGYALQVDPSTRQSVTKTLNSYIESPYEDIRNAAVYALQHYPTNNIEIALLKAATDPSLKVRRTSRMVFVNKASSSQALKDQALQSLQDASLVLHERLSISRILTTISLSQSENNIVDQLTAELKATYDNFDDRQKRDHQEQLMRDRGL